MLRLPKKYRLIGANGFAVPHQDHVLLCSGVIQSGWEHVVVEAVTKDGTGLPSWDDMCFIKDLFWEPEDVVIQIHPKRSEYVNDNPYALHLWRHVTETFLTPPMEIV